MMHNAFIRKLEYGARLTDDDRQLLHRVSQVTRHVPARQEIIGEGDAPSNVHLLIDGLACRYKILPDGRRQIMAIFLPGDICDLHVQILGWMDHSIGSLGGCRIAEISPDTIDTLTANSRINRALWWATLVDEGTLREWLVNLGQRSADRRVAHLLCELLVRFRSVGLAEDNSFPLPMTQEDLADTTGLTSVHVNRMLRDLRERGFIALANRHVAVPDPDALMAFCDFNPNYLHLHDPRSKPGPAVGAPRMA